MYYNDDLFCIWKQIVSPENCKRLHFAKFFVPWVIPQDRWMGQLSLACSSDPSETVGKKLFSQVYGLAAKTD